MAATKPEKKTRYRWTFTVRPTTSVLAPIDMLRYDLATFATEADVAALSRFLANPRSTEPVTFVRVGCSRFLPNNRRWESQGWEVVSIAETRPVAEKCFITRYRVTAITPTRFPLAMLFHDRSYPTEENQSRALAAHLATPSPSMLEIDLVRCSPTEQSINHARWHSFGFRVDLDTDPFPRHP